MQINFTPKKIKAAKAYIENLDNFSKDRVKKTSFFKRFKRFFKLF